MISFDHDLCFLDCETLGLDREAPIWEVAGIRVCRDGGPEYAPLHLQILHHADNWVEFLPEQFADDYRDRFDIQLAVPGRQAAQEIRDFTDGAIIAGSNPSFDMDRLALLMQRYGGLIPGWHHHPLDIPSMVAGALASQALAYEVFGDDVLLPDPIPWRSSQLSDLIGVPAAEFARHTAIGDVLWCLAQWDAMNGATR